MLGSIWVICDPTNMVKPLEYLTNIEILERVYISMAGVWVKVL
jgi:hypothetical protein